MGLNVLFTCHVCRKQYKEERSDEEATREAQMIVPDEKTEEAVFICDVCYKAIVQFHDNNIP